MGRNFIVLFEEKEGSTAILRLLDNFEKIDIVRQVSSLGWEPLDPHNCGRISMRNYLRCLDLIYSNRTPYMQKLNRIYTATATRPIQHFDKDKSVGLKMRFQPQRPIERLPRLSELAFQRFSIARFRAHNVAVFVAVRQDVFRWALSKYHGDGTGKPGHLQFKLASGRLTRSKIPKIRVDIRAFEELLGTCERSIIAKRKLINRLQNAGLNAWPMLYECFCDDRRVFFKEVLSRLEVSATEQEITAALEKGTKFHKVHGHDIHEFVINADDVLEKFGDRYISW